MDCDAFRDDLLDVLYGEADAETARRFEDHSGSCEACREELSGFRHLRRDLAAWTVPPALKKPTPVARPQARSWLRLAAAVAVVSVGGLGLYGSEVRYESGGVT